ncbi:glutaredoxin family protein [Gracilibacillus dipsosauri]|uniref:Thioredoxin family protein n=1 Tax=Gracilibacillus dipsosauri TaxID=178340 RepID=A0A317L2Y4_9BACI|nr:glutaredoxin family protein [Gracilibacillus dipsosauri]PWU69248.1 thioredoxin family protein [Gracilibacillus dipsosauri]
MIVKLYGKKDCSLCLDAKILLEILQEEYGFEIEVIDIYQDETLLDKFHLIIPVVEIEGEIVDTEIIDLPKIENFLKTIQQK